LADWKAFLDSHPSGPRADLALEEQEKLSGPQIAAVTPGMPVISRPSRPYGGVTLASLGSRSPAPLSANEECALKPKDVFKECDNCPEMVVVPAGSFIMRSPKEESRDRPR
jgi:formylglycine-generating enzyme required for sulfatase activity